MANLLLELETLEVSFIEKQIVRFFIKDFCELKLSDAKKATAFLTKYYEENNKDYNFMNLLEFGNGATINREIREYAVSDAGNNYSRGTAILVKNMAQQLIGDYYLRFNIPRYPTKIFYQEDKAVSWIKKMLEVG